MTDRKAFEEGIILALVSPPLPHVAKKEPIAYSYNGVVLPGLPEVGEEYRHKVIVYHKPSPINSYTGKAYLYFMRNLDTCIDSLYEDGHDPHTAVRVNPGDVLYYATHKKGENVKNWGEPTTVDESDNYPLTSVKWTDTDIIALIEDNGVGVGEVALAASEPVPIYE